MVEKENSKKKHIETKLMERIIASKTSVMKKRKIKKHDWSKIIGIIDLDQSSDCVKEHDLI